MDRSSVALKVLFEDPFWIGVFERTKENQMDVGKIIFGPEPRDFQIYEMVLNDYNQLKFSPVVEAEVRIKPKNPKRIRREVKKQLTETGIGTKSQQALKLLQEQNKAEKKVKSRQQKEFEKEQMFQLKQEKRKQKHRGR